MKKVPVEQAVGLPLCHDITAMYDGFKGAAFRRGHIIAPEDVEKLLNLGKKQVFIWEENAGEIHEEEAALRLAAMAPVANAHYVGPSEGKVLLIADGPGMFRVDRDLLSRINAIGDITIATVPDHYPVTPGMRLASMRIVPLVTKLKQIEAAEALCREKKLLDLRPYRQLKAGVIITGSEVYTGRIQDKFQPVVRRKLAQYPCDILGVTLCDDDPAMIVTAAERYLQQGAELLIFTGGMSVDPDDITPTAIRALGANIITHGVSAQPGNMTLVGYRGEVAILGIPGAAISLPTTMFDVLLPQVFTGDKLTKEDFVSLGDGGLCLQCPVCHFPACPFGRY